MAEANLTKTCTTCKQAVSISSFSRVTNHEGKLRAQCNPCRARANKDCPSYPAQVAKQRAKRRADPSITRRAKLRQKYGMTIEAYETLLREQGGACALCGSTNPASRFGQLHIDHCHQTRRIRGLLSNPCNAALGKLGDTPDAIRRVLNYVSGGADGSRSQ